MLVATEDFLLTQMRALLGTKVRLVDALPGDWDDDMLRRFAAATPAAFLSFAGGERNTAGGAAEARIDGRWMVFAATGHPTEAARRRGTAVAVGAYELVEVLAGRMHGLKVPQVGTLSLLSVQNLFTGSVERQALTVYAMAFSLPTVFDGSAPDALLAPFITFDAQYDIEPFNTADHDRWLQRDYSNSRPDAEDTVTLQGAPT